MDKAGIYHTGIAKGHHHKGPRAAGNKSLISYRAGHGIVGYNGYIPSWESIPIPAKDGPATKAGAGASRERAEPAWVIEKGVYPMTTYQRTISRATTASRPTTAPATVGQQIRDPSEDGDFTQGDKSSIGQKSSYGQMGGSHSQAGMLHGHVDNFGQIDKSKFFPSPPFLGTTIYRTSYHVPKDDLEPIQSRPRKKPAFLQGSTYTATYENTVEMMHGPNWLEEQSKKPRTIRQYGTKWEPVEVQRIPERTNYQGDYGEFGEGYQGMLPDHHLGISEQGTTRHLFAGTAKAFKRMPGYCGFVPETNYNKHAVKQATNDHDRPDPKNCRLFTLQQYLLDIPGTATFRPKDAANLIDGPKGRVGTAYCFTNEYMDNPQNVAELARKRATEKHFGTTQGTRTFFQSGDVCQSENGIKNAESFYRLLRPYEGLPRVSRPSETAESGYKFGCYTDRV